MLIFALVSAFAVQGGLIYTDGTAAAQQPLDEWALQGRSIYLKKNCAACHQLHGFGGFLGPDLTNAAQRVSRLRLQELLTVGSKQMPAFGLSSEEVEAVEAYLQSIDRTGIGVARAVVPPPLEQTLAALQTEVAAVPADSPVARGHRIYTTVCATCHLPLRGNPLGAFLAPDPTRLATRLLPAELEAVVKDGRPARGMPPPPLTAEQRPDVIAFLTWLAETRPQLVAKCGEGQPQGLPWWEYR